MKIGDRVKVINPLYSGIIGNAIGTIISEHIPNSQFNMFHPIQMWNIEFSNPELNHYFKEDELELLIT